MLLTKIGGSKIIHDASKLLAMINKKKFDSVLIFSAVTHSVIVYNFSVWYVVIHYFTLEVFDVARMMLCDRKKTAAYNIFSICAIVALAANRFKSVWIEFNSHYSCCTPIGLNPAIFVLKCVVSTHECGRREWDSNPRVLDGHQLTRKP